MISRTLLVLALLLGAALVTAQPAEDGAAAADTTGQAGDGSDPGTADNDQQSAASDRAPSDYRPSEQISEDLSVSFPVDI